MSTKIYSGFRFVSSDMTRIRANQGHSVAVEVGLKKATPPNLLYHGTAKHSISAIVSEGIRPMSRLYVHLSSDVGAARLVGARHGEPAVLIVFAGDMHLAGNQFFLSENGVWLTKCRSEIRGQYL